MYKVLEVSSTGKCSPGISTEPGIDSYGRVHYQPQVGYHNNYKVRIKGKVEQSRKWRSTLPYTLVF